MSYEFAAVEKKWSSFAKATKDRQNKNDDTLLRQGSEFLPAASGKKFYCLDMFPYPSGSGL